MRFFSSALFYGIESLIFTKKMNDKLDCTYTMILKPTIGVSGKDSKQPKYSFFILFLKKSSFTFYTARVPLDVVGCFKKQFMRIRVEDNG